jgi:phosphatidylserine synthase
MGTLFSVMSYLQTKEFLHLYLACGLIPLALLFDVLAGHVARWRRQNSAMERELDFIGRSDFVWCGSCGNCLCLWFARAV